MNSKGFTLLEILMYLTLFAILTGVGVSYMERAVSDSAFEETRQEMQTLKWAVVGDSTLQTRGVRTDFGYHGDLGGLPATLSGLLELPAGASARVTDNARRFISGWNGPYLRNEDSGTDFTKDGWGRSYIYSPTSTPPTLTSFGANGVVGGTGLDQDITIAFSADIRLATVHGFLVSGSPAGPADVAATITIHYPDGSGNRTSSTVSTVVGDGGHFSFSSIPFGVRSLEITYSGTTYGPFIITVDRAVFTVPSSVTTL